ncbi:kinesin-like protein KIN-1 isoform X1 [Cryptomeria japonica]|uniref:kinesin-like protein KIN-1 isoform X1 n=2 Tax=Cryptomeria japonica TaxID=3369 RepID=UPI0027DA2157|nr:kinesin-like protein KIN-1 isoform X1 [Cryptomeria japonica]
MFSEPTQFGAKSFYKQFSCVIVDSRSQALKMSNVSVCVRFRPLNARELKHGAEASCVRRFDDQSFVFKEDKEGEFTFCFDRIYYQDSTQAEVFEFLALPIIKDAMNAINGTILTYGQTGAGKTHSMEGPSILTTDQQQKGILPRVIEYIFTSIEAADTTSEFIIKLSMVEIYMERIRDLFDPSKDNLQVKEDKAHGIFVSGATEIYVQNVQETLKHIAEGIANRAVGETQMNSTSSRSHCVFLVTIHQTNTEDGSVKTGKLYLVDLAGSEKVEKTGAEGKILHEAKTINKSLSALGNVINALTTDKPCHIPYRDSKLTRILQESLGGNSRTALLCCCSPSSFNASESLSTLRFGTRAKQIRNKPKVNKERGQHELEQLIVKYEQECEQLRRQLLMLNARLHSLEKGEMNKMSTDYPDSCIKTYNKDGLLGKLKESLSKRTPVLEEIINLLRDLLVEEGIILESCNTEFRKDLLVSSEAEINKTILILQKSLEQLSENNETLTRENESLKVELRAARYLELNPLRFTENPPSNSSGSASFTICEKAKIIRPIRGGSQYTQVIDSAKSHRENAGNVASLSFLQLTLANIKSRFLFLMGKV